MTSPMTIVWSPLVPALQLAFDHRQAVLDDRCTRGPPREANTVEAIRILLRESPRDLLLSSLQNVDRELRRRIPVASTPCIDALFSMQISTSGGSRLSEQNALTVMPWSYC